MPRRRQKIKQYVNDVFQEDAPDAYFEFKATSRPGLSKDETEFVQAIESGAVQVVMSHLNCGLDPNFTVNPSGETPLHLAAESCKMDKDPAMEKIVGQLLYFGADTNAVSEYGNTPLHVACRKANTCFSIVENLVAAGSDVNAVNEDRETSAMLLCNWSRVNTDHTLNFLIRAGADLRGVNSLGQTVLHYLTKFYHATGEGAKVAETLLRAGLSATAWDKTGHRPIDMVLSGETFHQDIVLILIRGGESLPFYIMFCLISVYHDYESLLNFLRCAHHVTPSSDLRELHWALSAQDHSRYPMAKTVMEEVETYLREVSTLRRLCRQTVRSALGGFVFASVESLPLPVSVREYITSID